MSDQAPLDPRVAELLSAHVDGALSDDERATADAWVERSSTARAERDSLASVKAAVAGLPSVEPQPGFFETMLDRGSPRAADVVPFGRRRWAVVAGAVATAAAWVVVAGTEPQVVDPPVNDAEIAAVAGTQQFALHRQEGEVDWSDLPRGVRATEDGAETWVDLTTDPGVTRVVVQRDDVVYTLVSERLDAEALVAIAVVLPGDGESVVDRLRRAGQSLLDAISVDG